MGVSRVTVREAIKILASKNIVIIKRGKGTFVNPVPGASDDPFGFEFISDEEIIADLRELRYYIEPSVARLAAKHSTKSQLREMQTIIDKMRVTAELSRNPELYDEAVKRFCNFDQLFHDTLYEITGNSMLKRMKPAIMKSVQTYYFSLKLEDYYDLEVAFQAHLKIFEAIKMHDEDAAYHSTIDHMLSP